jgi:hypothetical protein
MAPAMSGPSSPRVVLSASKKKRKLKICKETHCKVYICVLNL